MAENVQIDQQEIDMDKSTKMEMFEEPERIVTPMIKETKFDGED